MTGSERLHELTETGRMQWVGREHAWSACPDEVVSALARDGFHEYKREVTQSRRGRGPTGGVWQGLNESTGAVASAIWIKRSDDAVALVFIDIDGEPVQGP
jgi:hypothetical protein